MARARTQQRRTQTASTAPPSRPSKRRCA
jgi:hypothetical protein